MQALKMLCDKIKGKANFSDSEEEEMHALLMFGIAPGPSLGLTPVTKKKLGHFNNPVGLFSCKQWHT